VDDNRRRNLRHLLDYSGPLFIQNGLCGRERERQNKARAVCVCPEGPHPKGISVLEHVPGFFQHIHTRRRLKKKIE